MTAVVLPVLAGRLVRHHRAQTHQLQQLTAELEHERERTAQMAVAEERARIARELHDVVAHGLSVIAIQADGAEAALEKDPELARKPLQAIRRSAEEALGEMRRLLGVLREADTDADLAPQPGLAQLPALVERARAAGLPVTLHVEGTPRPLHASLDLSAFRIVQEALTNVHKHAAGRAGHRAGRVAAGRARAAGARHRHGAPRRGQRRRPRAGRHARAREAARWRAARGRDARRRLRGHGQTAHGLGHIASVNADASSPRHRCGRTTVLLADDQELVRAGFRLILELEGFEVVGEARDGAQALELARELEPDVVLMDVRMPGMDGIEATRASASPACARACSC